MKQNEFIFAVRYTKKGTRSCIFQLFDKLEFKVLSLCTQ